ncbi:MAG TPA: CZB domain-containing protein [Rhodocyclaceae bacterium]|nr:CZB domain-containing protein [Rhodocyclaceae bacterium]
MEQPTIDFNHSPVSAAAGTGSREFVLIQVGPRSFGLPLSQVRYVAPLPSGFRCSGSEVADHFVFEGTPLSYISLWDTLGLPSAYVEYEQLKGMLPQRRQDHLDWMASLETSLQSGTAFAKARNPHECAFGKWFYSYQPKDRRLAMLLREFEQPHAMIHSLADRLLNMQEAGHGHEAITAFNEARKTTLATLMHLFEEAQHLMTELHRQIAVIVAHDEDSMALGADAIRDIVVIPGDRIRVNPKQSAADGRKVASDLIILDDQSVVPLIDWAWFSGVH